MNIYALLMIVVIVDIKEHTTSVTVVAPVAALPLAYSSILLNDSEYRSKIYTCSCIDTAFHHGRRRMQGGITCEELLAVPFDMF